MIEYIKGDKDITRKWHMWDDQREDIMNWDSNDPKNEKKKKSNFTQITLNISSDLTTKIDITECSVVLVSTMRRNTIQLHSKRIPVSYPYELLP